jgi:hypothetical protein
MDSVKQFAPGENWGQPRQNDVIPNQKRLPVQYNNRIAAKGSTVTNFDLTEFHLPVGMPVAVSTATKVATGVWHYLHFPLGANIHGYTILANASGSIVFDLWVAQYDGTNMPADANSICGAGNPTLTAVQFGQSFDLSAWSSTIIKRDAIMVVNVDSSTTISYAVLTLLLRKGL